MSDKALVNYPDILGAISGGPRIELDAVQCAVTTRPDKVGLGQNFEVILLIQNTIDADVDVILEFALPQKDLNNQKGMIFAKATRLQVGLRPSEVGYITMPAACSPKTAPGQYMVNFNIQVKRLSKAANRIRLPHGGGGFDLSALKTDTQNYIQNLRQLTFSMDTGGKRNHLQDTFEILDKRGIAKLKELQPAWVSLWTMDDYMDDAMMFRHVQADLEAFIPKLTRGVVFQPLFQATQARFRESSYPLHVAEAIFITKILTLTVERTSTQPLEKLDPRDLPNWVSQLTKLVYQKKDALSQPAALLQRALYPAIVLDAIEHGFTMIKTVLREDFGTEEEMRDYGDMVVRALVGKTPLDFDHTYLPLVAAGVIANPQIVMPNEQVRESIHMLSQALKQRMPERVDDNAFIFGIVDNLIQRALEHF